MTILPINARRRSLSEDRTILISPLKRCSYCVNTVFMDSLYETGYNFIISFTSNASGKSPKMDWISLSSNSSKDWPFPSPDSAEQSKTDSRSRLV